MSKDKGKKRFTASHIMLYVILLVYISVVTVGLVTMVKCIEADDKETARIIFVALASMTTVCGTSTAGFYASKAGRENILQISMAKYKMRLKLAKDIFKEFKGERLDEKSLQFMRTLISDENVTQENPGMDISENNSMSGLSINVNGSDFGGFSNDEGLG